MTNPETLAEEIIDKEFENYDLSLLGFGRPCASMLGYPPAESESYDCFRACVRESLYRYLGFESYAGEQLSAGPDTLFARLLKRRLQRRLSARRTAEPLTEVDRHMAAGDSIAYKITDSCWPVLSRGCCGQSLQTPFGIEDFFWGKCLQVFPLEFAAVMDILSGGDEQMWEQVALLAGKISNFVTNSMVSSYIYRDVARDEVTVKSYSLLKEKVTGGDVQFKDPLHFRRYLHRVCINKTHEFLRANRLAVANTQLTEDSAFTAVEPDTPVEDVMELPDASNPYEMARFAAIVLLDSSHPLHARLTEGIKQKVELLLKTAVEETPYSQLVKEAMGKTGDEAQSKKFYDRIRQDVSRTKKEILRRVKIISSGR